MAWRHTKGIPGGYGLGVWEFAMIIKPWGVILGWAGLGWDGMKGAWMTKSERFPPVLRADNEKNQTKILIRH